MSKQTTLSLVAWGRAAPLWGAAAPFFSCQETPTLSFLSPEISRARGFRPARSGADSARKAFGKEEGGRGGGKTQNRRVATREAGRALGARWARAGARRVQGSSSRARRSLEGASRGLRARFWCSKGIPGKGLRPVSRPGGRRWRLKWSAGDLGHVQHSRAGGRRGDPHGGEAPGQVGGGSSAAPLAVQSPRSRRPGGRRSGAPRWPPRGPAAVVITVPWQPAKAPSRRSPGLVGTVPLPLPPL